MDIKLRMASPVGIAVLASHNGPSDQSDCVNAALDLRLSSRSGARTTAQSDFMQIPIIRGIIDRRILVNYRVDPVVLARVVPPPFRPQILEGYGIAGICLIRLRNIRPRRLPAFTGISSENAAHRIAVVWGEGNSLQRGVYIPRRDSSSILNSLAGGRLFPGAHHRSRFVVRESGGDYSIDVSNPDGTHVAVAGRISTELPAGSAFGTLETASAFFMCGSLGYSATRQAGTYDGLELRSTRWEMTPLDVRHVESSWFADPAIFPPGSVEFDSALLMRGIPHEWHGRGNLVAPTVAACC
jgi:hypothetical protein